MPSVRHTMWGAYADGWLTFQSASETRRLVPVPDGWDTASTAALELFCRSATPSPRVAAPAAGDAPSETSARADR